MLETVLKMPLQPVYQKKNHYSQKNYSHRSRVRPKSQNMLKDIFMTKSKNVNGLFGWLPEMFKVIVAINFDVQKMKRLY